jgi:hypothetical protein
MKNLINGMESQDLTITLPKKSLEIIDLHFQELCNIEAERIQNIVMYSLSTKRYFRILINFMIWLTFGIMRFQPKIFIFNGNP